MPLVTLTVRKPKSAAFKASVLDAVHAALIAVGVPEKDRFQRVIELDADDFRFDANYPDATSPRSEDFVRNIRPELINTIGLDPEGLGQLLQRFSVRSKKHRFLTFNETGPGKPGTASA